MGSKLYENALKKMDIILEFVEFEIRRSLNHHAKFRNSFGCPL
jgi:hypothetical protein